jgi:hypothetical protein
LFIYNLGVRRSVRGSFVARDLVYGAVRSAQTAGAYRVLAEGPVPSYNGTKTIKQNLKLAHRLDTGGPYISDEEQELFFSDPHLNLYKRFVDCRALYILSNFIPEDQPSGGYRVMLYRNVRDFDATTTVSSNHVSRTKSH